MHLNPTLADAWDDIMDRRGEEAPGFQPPPLTSSLPPLTGPDVQPQVIITASRIPKPSIPLPALQIPILRPTTMPALNPWDQMTARRAGDVRGDWKQYLPFMIAGLVVLAALTMPKKESRHVATRRT